MWRGSRSDLNKDEPATRGAPTSRLLIGCQEACQVRSRLGEEISAAGFTSRGENSPGVFGSTSPRKFFLASLGTISVQIRYVMKSKMRFRRARKTLPRPRTIYFPKMVLCPHVTTELASPSGCACVVVVVTIGS